MGTPGRVPEKQVLKGVLSLARQSRRGNPYESSCQSVLTAGKERGAS
tara:strand:+ start:640 stop:780 length:141 start_codon:yes stop_codon:yes gene_type:complete